MIRVGITVNPNKPLFYSGANQTALLLAELCTTALQYQVTLVDYTSDDAAWFENYPRTYDISKLYQTRDLDILIDVDGVTSESARKQSAKKTVVFLRTFLQFAELDSQLYIETPYTQRSMKQVSEIWCWDLLNPVETIPSIQTMFPCPIRRVPFIWSSTVVSHYQSEVYCALPSAVNTVHIAEKNTDNTSSSILSIVALRELHRIFSHTYKVHNMDRIKENKFLKENVLNNIEFDTCRAVFAEKEPFYQWMQNDIILSHSRFTPLRIGLLNAVWLQIPLVHNSPFLRDFHPLLEKTYYEGNSIQGMIRAFSQITHSGIDRSAFDILSIDSKKAEWKAVFEELQTGHKQILIDAGDSDNPLVIAFDDMWPGFNYDSNFIMDGLRHEQPERSITGMRYDPAIQPNLLIFGPYSEGWKKVNAPKVYFSGENWKQPTDPSIALYISSAAVEDATHMRVPTWMHFIDWYSDKTDLPTNQEDNPIRIPLHYAVTPHPVSFEKRTKFCAFVVSNPVCTLRNDAFQQLNQYKHVSSGGAYQNNIGGQLQLKYPGGGCGDISKHHFFAEHQFTISFENSQAPGYLTEKLLHAKMAGCVPLYWGSLDTDFVPNSFVNLSGMTSAATVVDVVKKLESNPAICAKIASTPPLDEQRKQMALNTISAMSRRLLQIASNGLQQDQQLVDPVDKTYLINLDIRKDRLQSFTEVHPDIKFTRTSAIYGKELQMSQALYDLCKHNTFEWKKSVIACALSHISIWNQIVKDNATHTLILEDDVRLMKGWRDHVRDIPADAELLYLGGTLPTNRPHLQSVLEKVNEYWSQLKPNTFFTKEPIAHFHFCAYSYILTKKGAQKLLDYLAYSTEKLCIPADHLVGHPVIGLKKYIANTVLGTCFQEEDQKYNTAEFNELQSAKQFDSDIYNTTDKFDVSVYKVPDNKVPENKVLENKVPEALIIYYMTKEKPVLYEHTWLEDMFQKPLEFRPFEPTLPPNSWCLVHRPHVEEWALAFAALETPFHVLHMSDEFGTDPIDYYGLPMCKKVVRTYHRPNLPSHVITIPLGYHHKPTTTMVTPSNDRKMVWSFHGTDWFNRSEQLKQFQPYTPHHCKLQPQWNDPSRTKKADYLSLLSNSKFCPILRGNNMETFRLYEALEAGTLPVAIESNEYTAWIDEHLHLSDVYQWTDPKTMGQPITGEIQQEVVRRWTQWKEQIRSKLK